MEKYTASRLSEGNKLFPPTVTTESDGMKIKFPKLFGGKETFVSYKDISSISYDAPMIGFTQLNINIRGKVTTVEGFYKGDCQKIIDKWKERKNITESDKQNRNGKIANRTKVSQIENEDEYTEDNKATKSSKAKDQEQLITLRQLELETKRLELRKLEIETQANEQVRSKKRQEDKIIEKEIGNEKRNEILEKAAGVANNVKELISERNMASTLINDDKKEKLERVRQIKIIPNDKEVLIEALTSLAEYIDIWSKEFNPDEYLMVAKSNYDSGLAMLQLLSPNDPIVSFFTQKKTIAEKQARKTKVLFWLVVVGFISALGIALFIQELQKQ